MIELSKGQELALTTEDGHVPTSLTLGVGWDKAPSAGFIGSGAPEIDLDASAVQFAGKQLFDLAFYNNLATRDGSVVHQGDNRSGSGAGDDEAVSVDLTRVYGKVDTVLLLVSSYQGHTLEFVHNAYCRVVDDRDVELARLTLTLGVQNTGVAMAALVREPESPAGWRLRAIGEGIAVTVPTKSLEALQPFL